MFELKRLHEAAVPAALQRAERYRLLNQPAAAESICRDVLNVDPTNQLTLTMLILALTDQFDRHIRKPMSEARELVTRLSDEYHRAYYTGIILEREAKAILRRAAPGSGTSAYVELNQAMEWYEKAEALGPEGNDEALLRWNNCARIINEHEHVKPGHEDDFVPLLE
jgi:hypothetical protein